MEYVEAEGNTIDEAIERALAELGVSRDRAEIEILSGTTKGLFGLGGRKARVRASVRPALTLGSDPALATARAASAPAAEPAAPSSLPPAAPVAAAVLEQARAVLQEIVTRIGSAAQVTVGGTAAEPVLTIGGDPSGLLIGRHGQTLDALEYLVNRIILHEEGASSRITVDCEQYRVRRRQTLEEMARRLAARARSQGRPVTLDPMNPRDRRIVHLALQNDPGLTTRSTGEGYLRKLVIIPQGARRRGGRGAPRPASD
jgi:spoIIIJ-associated protein